MLYIFKILLLLINIDQETVLNWFGIQDPINQVNELNYDLDTSAINVSPALSLETISLIIHGLWEKVQDGLSLADIENLIFFIAFFRFAILAVRYNLKTSFYITCIGLAASYLWYRHFLDLLFLYQNALLRIPITHKLGIDAIELKSMYTGMKSKANYNLRASNPIGIIFHAFGKGIFEDGYYIDPISMLFANIPEKLKSITDPVYYLFYRKIIPTFIRVAGQFYREFGMVAAYTLMTRMGKKYCPYLIRWHWTFLLMMTFLEQFYSYFIFRVNYYVSAVLVPQIEKYPFLQKNALATEIETLKLLVVGLVLYHMFFVLFGLFHALCGQYFYVPLLTENTELHVGPRLKESIYSGGYTSWQDIDEKIKYRTIPKLWYGWFGRGTKNDWNGIAKFQKFIKKLLKKFIKLFKR
uniref:Hypothetical chloroplast RF90 n=1 Tax=Nanofrustulum shiloi TaxID=210602 RepID=A0A650G1A5_9STRA|nr:hypothetical chloroplast RF90 [Nanofrustulum shiloi]